MTKKFSQEKLDESFLLSAGWNELDRVKFWLAEGANLNAVSESFESALHLAIQVRSDELCEFLVKSGARLDGINKKGDSPLHAAASRSMLDCCRLLIEAGADVNLCNDEGQTPMHSAGEAEDPRVVELLVAAGAQVKVYDVDGYSPLHFSALRDRVEAARVLVGLGLSSSDVPSVPGNYCFTPFQRAVFYGRVAVASYFVAECGESLDQVTQDGRALDNLSSVSFQGFFETLRAVATQTTVGSAMQPDDHRSGVRRSASFSPL